MVVPAYATSISDYCSKKMAGSSYFFILTSLSLRRASAAALIIQASPPGYSSVLALLIMALNLADLNARV
jgi:hypothetical protein